MTDDTRNTDPLAAIEETMGDVFDDIEAREEDEDTAPQATEGDGDGDDKGSPSPKADKEVDGPVRDPQTGRFVKQEGSDDAPPAPKKAAKQEQPPEEGEEDTSDEEDEDDQGDKASALRPPDRWSKEDKEQFASLPREAQKIVLKREADVERHLTKESQAIADLKRHYDSLESILGPRRQELAQYGYQNDAQAIDVLFKHSDFAIRDPAGYVLWFSQHRGVDLAELADRQMQDGYEAHQADADPALTQLSNRVQTLEHSQRQAAESYRMSIEQQARQSVDAFATEKDASGNLLRPHVEAVRPLMATLIEQSVNDGRPIDLQTAYDQAVWAHPETRALMLKAGQGADQARKAAQAKEAAAKAKRAAGTHVRQRGTPAGGTKPLGSLDETLADAYDAAVSRG